MSACHYHLVVLGRSKQAATKRRKSHRNEKEGTAAAASLLGSSRSCLFFSCAFCDSLWLLIKFRRAPLVGLLERGIEFDGAAYITEAQFAQKYRGKKKILPHLGLNQFVRETEMVRIVPIQAPRNYTADITLRKGSASDSSLPVLVKRTDVEADYPFLTKELAAQIGKNQNWTAKATTVLSLKGDPKFHQAVRASATSLVHRYSSAAVQALKQKLVAEPAFDPYHDG